MNAVLWALIAVPAIAGVSLCLGGRHASRTAGPVAAFVCAVTVMLASVAAAGRPEVSTDFVSSGPMGLAVDGLAAVVIVMVTVVALLVVIFAVGSAPAAPHRFFGLLLIFIAAVLLTVTASTLVALLLAWEVMGATSYALIAHHWDENEAVGAGTTAFLVTQTGDLGLYAAAGAALAGGMSLSLNDLATLDGPWLHIAAAGLLAASLGKAAQLPFSFWLSRAMSGPSPVSALLHSAAMVAMGAYLLLRLHPLLTAAGWAAPFAAWVGALTALVLGAVAVAQTDLKQLLAASTGAQLGFVVLAAGSTAPGAVAAGAGQLVAHAATKSLLFLIAGVWLAALGARELDQLVGVARRDPRIGWLFTAGIVTLAGLPPLSLWATKDSILSLTAEGSVALYVVALAAAALSAAYAAKALAIVWKPTKAAHAKLANPLEWVPLVPLAVTALALGVLAVPAVASRAASIIGVSSGVTPPWWEPALATALAVAVFLVVVSAVDRLSVPAFLANWLGLERAAHLLIVQPTFAVARRLAAFDDQILDRAVISTARSIRHGADLLSRFDDLRLDRGVGAFAEALRRIGGWARLPQTGQVHQYYAQAAVGLLAALLILLVVR